MTVRTRFAPSPTGYLHIGSLRAALFEYAYAKTYGGDFILRIEDTDRKRFVEGATEKLMDSLRLFGITWDEGPQVNGPYTPYIQSERVKLGIYKEKAEKLINSGHAYYCFCKSESKEKIKEKQDKLGAVVRDVCRDIDQDEASKRMATGEKAAVRLKVPDAGDISYHDFVLDKDITWDLKDVDEAMLLKSDGFPTYHLAVVVDDSVMGITNILRGFEWLPSTPIHLLIFKYLGENLPEVGHFSLILDPSGGKLSKRKGNVTVEDFLKDGYLPEAMLNFVMLLGWAPKDNREIFTLSEYVTEFKNGKLQISNAVFNREKLDWFNGYYIRQMSNRALSEEIYRFYDKKYPLELIEKLTPLVKERIVTLKDFEILAGFIFEGKKVEESLFEQGYTSQLNDAYEALSKIEKWNLHSINESLMALVTEKGYNTGKFFMNVRIAVSGSRITPPINESLEILGKEETLKRLKIFTK
jgi:glutamyl-tRNA synthetase